jgi:hypothetical protein
MKISILPYPSSSTKYEDCMEAKVENITVENVSDDDCPKATSPSQQFPLFLIRIDNELASKAKDSLELYLLVEKIVWKLKLRIS